MDSIPWLNNSQKSQEEEEDNIVNNDFDIKKITELQEYKNLLS